MQGGTAAKWIPGSRIDGPRMSAFEELIDGPDCPLQKRALSAVW